ncbi:MAG: hypothetical protein EAX96_09075 [Candidatus Lokiarchaeota archaeon]|nr:hypothetical protein [Candidatus Lokiarchaeota archaeon]
MKLILHTCCAACATIAVERLQNTWEIIIYFSNSNLYPKEEFKKRLNDVRKIADIHSIELIVDAYNEQDWLFCMKGLENEPERGERCKKCIEYRLKRTFEVAKEKNFDAFTTTLTTSPHKDANFINTLGKRLEELYGIQFIPLNLKKQDGFRRSLDLSKKFELYRQDYCGCRFSIR